MLRISAFEICTTVSVTDVAKYVIQITIYQPGQYIACIYDQEWYAILLNVVNYMMMSSSTVCNEVAAHSLGHHTHVLMSDGYPYNTFCVISVIQRYKE